MAKFSPLNQEVDARHGDAQTVPSKESLGIRAIILGFAEQHHAISLKRRFSA
ncbi:hypothetical protein B4110_3580 [Parageobacillus toebii]|uniref:Uncharacterized protein n=1 Tax=Parageobacillus toebii TaxID=153151 RepID=A0A150N7S2_9BACL|nr:hypothetical protein B4110_3580 [Parageobacillus toebii]